jgi:hypothetical protein
MTHKIALTGWPTGERCFPGLDVKTFRTLPNGLLRKIAKPMMDELMKQYHDTNDPDPVALQFEEWSESSYLLCCSGLFRLAFYTDDKALALSDQGDVGLVFDLDGLAIVSVKHIRAWWTAVADALQQEGVETDMDVEPRKKKAVKATAPVDVKGKGKAKAQVRQASVSEDEDEYEEDGDEDEEGQWEVANLDRHDTVNGAGPSRSSKRKLGDDSIRDGSGKIPRLDF